MIDTAEKLRRMNIEGYIIPFAWCQTIITKNGKPHWNAIAILSEMVYMYRPVLTVNAGTGEPIYAKKFKGDKLHRKYSYYEKLFGLSQSQVRSACDFLIEVGLITKENRTVDQGPGGMPQMNVLFWDINIEKLNEVTYIS